MPQQSGKLVFETLLPSPLGRVAERSEVGRGSLTYCFLALFRKMAPENLFRQPFGLPPSPKGKARRFALQNYKHHFAALRYKSDALYLIVRIYSLTLEVFP